MNTISLIASKQLVETIESPLVDTMQSSNISQYIQNTGFQPDVYLNLCLLKYFESRTSPNIKILTLNNAILMLNYLECSSIGGDITTFVKLALRFKNLMKVIPQSLPIEKDQKFDEWYTIFLRKIKSQIAEAFSKIKAESDENETFIKRYLLSDTTIMTKCLMVIERDIIKYSKDNKKSEENAADSLVNIVNNISDYIEDSAKDGNFSSEDEEPLNCLIQRRKSVDINSTCKSNSSEESAASKEENTIPKLPDNDNSLAVLETNQLVIDNLIIVDDLNNKDPKPKSLDEIVNSRLKPFLSNLDEQVSNTKVNNELITESSNLDKQVSKTKVNSELISGTSDKENVISKSDAITKVLQSFVPIACKSPSDPERGSAQGRVKQSTSENSQNLVLTSSNSEAITKVLQSYVPIACKPPSDKQSTSENSNNLVLTSLNSGSLVINTSETINNVPPNSTANSKDVDIPTTVSEMNVTSITLPEKEISTDEPEKIVNETTKHHAFDDSEDLIKLKMTLRSYDDIIKEAMNTEITTTEIITLDDDDDNDDVDKVTISDVAAVDTNSKDETNKTDSEKTLATYLQSFVSETNDESNPVNPTSGLPESTHAELIVNENDGENSQTSSDIVITNTTPQNFLIDKQSIKNSIPFRTFISNAKMMYRCVKSSFIDDFFLKYCASHGNFSMLSQKQLLAVLCKNFLDIDLYKRVEIYTDIVVSIFKFCVENAPELLDFTFDAINNDGKLFGECLIQFKSMLKYMLYFCLDKLQTKLKTLQKYTADILITPDDVQDLAIAFNVLTEAHFKALRLISQSNIIDIKYSPLPRQGLTIRQIYNFPGVTVKCQFTDIVFGRTNLSNYKSCVTLTTRKDPAVVNKRLIGDKKLKLLEQNEKDVALSTKYLMNYFQNVFVAFQQGELSGIKYLRDVCSEFLKDIEYISPSRKAMVMNSEYHCSLSNYAYSVVQNLNMNRISLKHVFNPEMKVFLIEPDTPDQCSLTLICNLCNLTYEAFDSEVALKTFSKHLVRVHGYFVDSHTCVNCFKTHSFQELLNKRWTHECYK